MMEQQTTKEQLEEVRKLAKELHYQGERCALAGLLEQATAILAQVWAMAQECDPARADAAAWDAGWLQLQMRSYDRAAQWFGRMREFPGLGSQLWPAAKQTLLQLCRDLAQGIVAPAPAHAQLSLHALSATRLPQLRVISLGRFQIIRDARLLPICTAHKAIAVFRYLLSRRHHTARKEELLELLWPTAHASAATHSLHVAITTLRRYLDPPDGSYLLFEAGHYLIHPDAPIADDARDFEQHCGAADRHWHANDVIQAQQSYNDAIACYQGDYHVGEQDFAWAIAEQERLQARYLTALNQLGQILITRRQFEPASACYLRLLERDSYREDAHCQLMRCYLQLGRRYEALRQYERCADILANDLGLEPMQELQELYYAIQSGARAPEPQP
jgi:DNA-binding SARP family transcriptional activator